MADLRVEKVDQSAYKKFLSENSPDDPYSLPPLLEAYRDVFSREVEYLHVFRSDTAIASCAIFHARELLQNIVKLMPLRAYDGIHFRSLDESNTQKREYDRLMSLQVLEEFLRKNYDFYQLVLQPGIEDIRPFQWAGAGVIPQYTYVVDLGTFSADNYTKSLKEVLRAAERSGLSGGRCSVDELISLNTLSYERHGRRPPVPQDKLRELLTRIEEAGLLEIACAKNKDARVIAGMASLRTDRALYFFLSGTDARAEKGASHFLYNEILVAEKKVGRAFVDFVGANTPTINMFKSAFGPRLETHYRVWRANSAAARLASLVKKI